MPKITQGNAREHLFATIQKLTELTGEQVGAVFTWKGKLNTIGKHPFKEFVNSHPVDIQTSLISSYNPTYVRPTESTEPLLLDVSESETDIAKLILIQKVLLCIICENSQLCHQIQYQ